MKRFGIVSVGLLSVILWQAGPVRAEEGMFMLSRLDQFPFQRLAKAGLQLNAEQLKQLEPAVVQVAGHGTGSFVSSDGLIVTNHHVAFGCIAALDGTREHKGIMDAGFVAAGREKELPCPGYYVLVVRKVEDVTAKVLSVVRPKMSFHKRYLAVLEQQRRIERDCEKQGGVVCEVKPANGGAVYTLSVYDRIRDIRLVYAPPEAIGKFGGDIDNWRYPRHTPDFTFLRAYVSPDGKGAPYSANNRVYHPKRHLTVSVGGVRRGDLMLVMGFPGRTMRHTTAFAAEYYRKTLVPFKQRLFRKVLDALPKKGLSRRRYQALDWGLNNAVKYYTDLGKQFDTFGVLDYKRRQQTGWQKAISSNPLLSKGLSGLFEKMKKIYAMAGRVARRATLAGYLTSSICRSLQVAADIVRWSRQKKISDLRRELDRYRDKNMYRVYDASAKLEQLTTLDGERAVISAMLSEVASLPKAERLKSVDWLLRWGDKQLARLARKARKRHKKVEDLFKARTGMPMSRDKIRDTVALMLAETKIYGKPMGDKHAVAKAVRLRKKMFRWSYARLRRDRDPLLQFARRLVDDDRAFRQGPLAPLYEEYRPVLWPKLVDKVIRPPYYDANFTVRLSYGFVRDYREAATGKKWRYLSRLTWLVRKDRGKKPFLVPKRLKDVYRRKDFGRWVDPVINDVPVDFTATLDTTGGNSGSPVLNGRGQLVGLLFDGTPESIVSDWLYMAGKQRSICVDIRVVLFLAEKVDHAISLLKELGIQTQGAASSPSPRHAAR